jgi:uncharacterized protein YlxW (UPF0749 family)
VSQSTEAGSPQLFRFLMTPMGRFLGIVAFVILIVCVAAGSYALVRLATQNEEKAANARILQLQTENQKLTADNANQLATIAGLQSQIKTVQAKLLEIMPTKNTYNISPNQALVVADGRLTIGLVGSPANEGVNININGKPQKAAAGTIINVVLDPSTTCQVGVQSFDMFKAVLTASCGKP